MGQIVIVSQDASLERLLSRTARLTSWGQGYRWTWVQPIGSQLVRVCAQRMPEFLLLDLRMAAPAMPQMADLARRHVTKHPLCVVGLGPRRDQLGFVDHWMKAISVQELEAMLFRR